MMNVRALALAVLVCATSTSAWAEIEPLPKAHYPQLASHASSVAAFVPAGWKLEARADGDLDGDGTPDVAFVLHGNDPALVVKNDGLGEQELDTNPRILVVVLRRGSRFELAVQTRTLIARRDDPSMEDPFDDDALEIRRGSLRVSLRLFMTAGGWTMFRSTFTFRLDRGRKLSLVGFDQTTIERNTGGGETVSANFLTGRARVESAPDAESKPRHRWKSVSKRLLPIEKVGNGLDFEVGRGG
jgi:hypothetical protein